MNAIQKIGNQIRLKDRLPSGLYNTLTYNLAQLYFIIGIGKRISWLHHLSTSLFFGNFSEEIFVTTFLFKLKGKLFVDIGSYWGRYSLLLSKNFEHIIAIEPHPENYRILTKNVLMSGANNITCKQVAICNKNGRELLFSSHTDMGTHSLQSTYYYYPKPFQKMIVRHNINEAITVNTQKLSTLLHQESEIHLVKVDVEGAEFEVLKSSEEIVDVRI